MFDYIVRLLVWAVEGGAKVSLHPVDLAIRDEFRFGREPVAPQSGMIFIRNKCFLAILSLLFR